MFEARNEAGVRNVLNIFQKVIEDAFLLLEASPFPEFQFG